MGEVTKRYAVVTGTNKGIGFGLAKQLASQGIIVVLTARDEKRGLEAIEKFKELGLSDNVVLHQLDVIDPTSVATLADFIITKFGKLDILVNNAEVRGNKMDVDAIKNSGSCKEGSGQLDWAKMVIETYELSEECLETNHYGAKRTCEALIPLLQFSESPKTRMPDGWAKGVLSDFENLTEEKIDELLTQFLKDNKESSLANKDKGWSPMFPAYELSKAALNAYTRILAKKYQSLLINCGGYVKTDINFNAGTLTVDEGAESIVRLALLPKDGPSGLFFIMKEKTHPFLI